MHSDCEGDSDCQGDEDSRSTSGAHIEVNGFVLSHYSTTQPGLLALSSGESELRSLTRAGCEGVYVKHVLAEFGLESTIKIAGDASAALSAASKLSGGRMRHLKGCDAFIKQLVKRKVVRLEKIGTKENAGDLLTKHVSKDVIIALTHKTGYRARHLHEMEARIEKLVCMNTAADLKSADLLVLAHEQKSSADAQNAGLQLLRKGAC